VTVKAVCQTESKFHDLEHVHSEERRELGSSRSCDAAVFNPTGCNPAIS